MHKRKYICKREKAEREHREEQGITNWRAIPERMT